jgi:hypothetical protein
MRIEVEITGVTGIMFNRFTEAAQIAVGDPQTTSSRLGDYGKPYEICENKLHKDKNGKTIVPQTMLMATIVNGGLFFKNGRSKITTQKSSMLYGCLEVEGIDNPAYSYLIHEQPWRVDTRPVKIPATGGRILCHRPLFDDWKLRFNLVLDTTEMNAKMLRAIVDAAGKKVGLADYRPLCKGPYGKFVVTYWKEIEEAEGAKDLPGFVQRKAAE